MPPNELMIGSVEKKFIDELLHNYNQLANESKKKFPNVKEACETGIMRVRNTASSPAIIASAGFRNSLINESAPMMEPFFMGCDTKSPKLVQISLNAIQKAILFECLNVQAANNLINCLWNLMEHGLEEVKVLQTITLLITMNHLVQGEQLAKALSLCFRLNYTKNSTINNTASATVRQLTTILFERVPSTKKCENSPNQSDDHQDEAIQKKLFDIVPCDNDSCKYIPINLKSAALDAFNLMQDLIQIVNGETPFWLKNIPEISKIFGLELLELVIDQYPQIFHEYEEFSFLLKEKICQLVIKLFSPNIKQRSHLLLNPMLKEWSSNNLNINNNNNNGGNTVNTNNNNSAQSFQPPIWSTTVRLMRIVSVLIKNYFEILITESEIFLSLLIKSLEVDKFNWQRLIALEAIFRMICPKILCSLCQNYDMKPQSSKILRDIVNALCIFIQSQFQVVDSSTTQSLIASLVNNNNSGNSNITNTYNNSNNHSNNNNATGPITLNRTNNNNNNQNHFPTFNLRGIAISLLFIPMDKEYRYKTFYIDQLDKQESPVAPEGHGLSTAVACVFEIVTALVKTIETDLDITIQTKDRGSAVKPISMENYNQEMVELHRQMLVSTFSGLIGTFSLLLDASADDIITGLVLEQMQKLIIIYGLYKVDVARDSLLISICKSSLPSNYYSIPALNPDDLPLEDNLNGSKQPETLSKSANVGLISFRSMSSVGINLPNLLSQQNNHPLNNNQASKTTNLTQIENNLTGSHPNDSSKQVIAVGTPLPNNNQTNPGQQQGPVMLNAKNLQCMSSIMQVSMTYAFVYEEKSWHIVFTTLQHLVWILGMKPNNINLYKLNQNYQNQSLMISGSGQNPANSNIDQSYQDEATTASSDLPVLTAMLSRLFECTHYNTISEHLSSVFFNTQNISDDSLMTMMKALITLSNEAMEVAYNNREPSLFAIVKIHESALVNLKRVDLFWELITSHLIQVSSHPYHKLRECGVEMLCNLVKSVLNFIHLKRKNENDHDGGKEDTGTLSESYYMSALQQLSEIKFIDIRQKQIECLLRILQSHGEDLIDGWPIVLNIIETACIPQNEKLIKHAFQSYEFVVSNLLRFIPSIHLIHCINAAVSFGSQIQELNVSLSAVGLIWNLADFLYSNQQKIQASIEQFAENGHEFVNVDLPFCENLTPMQSLWISLFKNLGNLCTDARLSVRKSSVQTLMSTLSKHGQILDYNTWKAIFFYVLFPLIDSVRALCALASNEKITQSESSKPNSYEEDSEYIIHYSRNTAFKQWCETQVSVINGVSRILTIKLDMLIINILSNQKEDNSMTNESDSYLKELTNSETILLNIWSLFFEFVYTSAVCTNSEVSMSAMKCFNETIKYLNEYQKNCTNNLIDSKKENAQKVQKLLTLIWKIVWKTWYNIGHNVSVEKVVNSESNTSNSGDEMQINHAQLQHHHRGTVFIPSQQFLCLLINPLFTIFNCNLSQFTESDFKNMSFIIQNVVALPFDVMNETCSYHHHHHHHHHGSNEHLLTGLQSEVISTLENIQDLMINNLAELNHLIPLMFHQNLAFSLYAVNIVPPNLNVFISSQNQHRFLPGELTTFKSMSYYIFGEIALKNAFNLYQFTYGEMIVIKSHILHSMIKAYKIPLCFKYSCPLQSTWKYAVNYFIKTLELGLPLARRFPNDFISIWADLALTFEGFLFPVNKPPTNQKLEDQQLDEALDVKVVELIRDHIMIHAQKIPKEFLLQIVSILNRGSIHSPSITSIETEVNRKLREDFARICFQTLLQFSFFGPKGNPDLFIQSKTNGSNDKSPEQTIGIVNKLAVASILKRFNDVIIKYVEDEQLCPCPLPRHRLSEISFVLKALATLISSLKQAPAGVVENHVWQQLIELYPRIVDCTMSNSPQVNNSIREVLHQYSCMLTCPKPGASSLANKPVEPNGNLTTNTTAVEAKSMMKMTSKDKIAKPPKSFQQNGNNEINI